MKSCIIQQKHIVYFFPIKNFYVPSIDSLTVFYNYPLFTAITERYIKIDFANPPSEISKIWMDRGDEDILENVKLLGWNNSNSSWIYESAPKIYTLCDVDFEHNVISAFETALQMYDELCQPDKDKIGNLILKLLPIGSLDIADITLPPPKVRDMILEVKKQVMGEI